MFHSSKFHAPIRTISRTACVVLIGFSTLAGGVAAAEPNERDLDPLPVFDGWAVTAAPPVTTIPPPDPLPPVEIPPVELPPVEQPPATPMPTGGNTGSEIVGGTTNPLPTAEPTGPQLSDTTIVEPVAALNSVSASSDSVVGHIVAYADFSRRITVRWGDGAVSTARLTSTIDVRHAYADERDGAPFTHFVTIEAEDFDGNLSTTVRRLDLVPRYMVTVWNASFRMLEHCDPFYEKNSEWDITRYIDGVETDFWEDNRQTSAGVGTTGILITYDFRRLSNSLMHREMTMADSGVSLRYTVYEDDSWYDDYSGQFTHSLHPSQGTGSRLADLNRDCHSQIRFDYQTVLLRPGVGAQEGEFALMN